MADMTCVYCGSKTRPGSGTCSKNPNKPKPGFSAMHVGAPDGKHCVYCGSDSRPGSGTCVYAPSGYHQLAL